MLCVVALLFSYSCKCRNNHEGKGDFIPNRGTGNVTDLIVYTSETSATNKGLTINFTSVGNKDYTVTTKIIAQSNGNGAADFTEITEEAKKLADTDILYDKTTKILELQTDGEKKIRDLTTTDNSPSTNKIVVRFTLKSVEDLNNPTQTFDIPINLIRAGKIGKDQLQKILNRSSDIGETDNSDTPAKKYSFKFSTGILDSTGAEYAVENDKGDDMDISKSLLKRNAEYYIKNGSSGNKNAEISDATFKEETGGGESDSHYSLKYNITYAAEYESDLKEITIKFSNVSTQNPKPKFVE